jgi:nitrate/nitrite transport system ATP-binding protein
MSTESRFLQVEQLCKAFPGGGEPVFDGVNFRIAQGEFVCIIGHSGCGKTTILNVVAGLETASSGHVFMDGREVAGPGLERGVVFQGHALLPWLTVRGNIAFAVRSKWPGWSRAQVDEHVRRYVALVGLEGAIDRKPSALSGGMKQRVGIARAFAIQPRMLLLDEPFGALDALTRGTIQDELLRICAETHQTVFMITHDVDEAILLADRILLMSNGPRARVAEIVRNTMPRTRTRATLHHDPQYYRIRNHLVDFLVSRSAELSHGRAPAVPAEVSPGLSPDLTPEPEPGPGTSSAPVIAFRRTA